MYLTTRNGRRVLAAGPIEHLTELQKQRGFSHTTLTEEPSRRAWLERGPKDKGRQILETKPAHDPYGDEARAVAALLLGLKDR